VFTLRFTDPENAGRGIVKVVFGDSTGDRNCAVFLDHEAGRVELQFDPAKGPGLRVSGDAGAFRRVENSVCAVDLSEAKFTQHGNDLEVRLPMIFKPGFEGPKNIKSWVWDKKGKARVDGLTSGQWMVGPAAEPGSNL
jgi:hypothetical protein